LLLISCWLVQSPCRIWKGWSPDFQGNNIFFKVVLLPYFFFWTLQKSTLKKSNFIMNRRGRYCWRCTNQPYLIYCGTFLGLFYKRNWFFYFITFYYVCILFKIWYFYPNRKLHLFNILTEWVKRQGKISFNASDWSSH